LTLVLLSIIDTSFWPPLDPCIFWYSLNIFNKTRTIQGIQLLILATTLVISLPLKQKLSMLLLQRILLPKSFEPRMAACQWTR
jgi:hypothetical protein